MDCVARISIELFTRQGSHIASDVGIPIYMDKSIEHCRRVDVARIYVEVSSDDLLPSLLKLILKILDKLRLQWCTFSNRMSAQFVKVLDIKIKVVSRVKKFRGKSPNCYSCCWSEWCSHCFLFIS